METCPKCKRSDEVVKTHTIEPITENDVKSFVCMRCMKVVATEGSDIEAIIYQLKER